MVSPSSHGSIYRFGTFEVFAESREIFRNGYRVKLQDQPFQLLLLLLENAGGIVDREVIRQHLWPENTFVDFGQSLGTAITKLRQALGDDADNPRFVETIPRRGYRFIAPVKVEHGTNEAGLPATATAAAGDALPTQPIQEISKSKLRLFGWVTIAALIAGIVGIYLYTRRTVFALTPKDTVVLADFENTTGEQIFNDTLRQGLTVGLAESPLVHVLSDRNSAVILRQMGHSPDDRITGRVAIDLCRRVGGKATIQGSVSSLGTSYLIGLAAIRCDTGKPVAREEAEASRKEDVIHALGKATARLRGQFGESLPSIQKYNAPLEQATTSSLEALEAFGEALSTWDAKGDLASVPFFKKAIALDPNFAMAYGGLATVYHNLGEAELAKENTTDSYKLRERVTETERASIDARYYLYVTRETDKAAQTYESLAQKYPESASSLNHLGAVELRLGHTEQAADTLRKALQLDATRATTYGNRALSLLRLNQLQQADSLLATANQRGLHTDYLLQVNYWLAFLRGDEIGMARLLHQSAGTSGAYAVLLTEQSHTEAYHGRLEKAQALSIAASEKTIHDGDKDGAANLLAQSAVWEAETGLAAKARSLRQQAEKASHNVQIATLSALVDAEIGDSKQALATCEILDKQYPHGTFLQNYWLPVIRAKVELQRRNATKAISLLSVTPPFDAVIPDEFATSPVYPAYVRGQAYLAARDGRRAADEFKTIIDRPGMVLNLPLGALARLGLARAYVLSGRTAEARDAYQSFFKLWSDADPDIPVLRQAHAEFDRLKPAA
jgi:DNA-binding winged helix-turn-helix (wHTH) protein/Tfp pilus assembly protein PilF